ncbi:hypothetical protein P8452_52271 [Trifolium repens]|nr:hypothetical protein P8452_52271 [Trifolium repens]
MQASIIYSPLPTKFIKFRTISSKQNPTFHRTTPCSHLKLCNFQTQSPLNISTLKSLKIFISNLGPLRCGISSNSESAKVGGKSFREWLEVAGEAISTAFPLWVTIGVDDLLDALSMPKEVLTGFFLQYSVMPISAFIISKLLNLPSHYAAGLILVGCCPGGTASNIVTYLARGNVALSVIMTAASTLAAVIMTPFLTAKLAGKYVAVDATGLLMSTLQVVLLPVLAGAFLWKSDFSIMPLHASGFFFGYILARMLRLDVSSSRTISIEVGMQNSALGVVLATKHFGDPLTTVPSAVSSVCHSIFGSILAAIWRFSVSVSVPAEIKDSK